MTGLVTQRNRLPICLWAILCGASQALAQDKGVGVEAVKAVDKLGAARYAVVIGINEYEDSAIPKLKYAEADAKAVYETLTDPQIGGIEPKNAVLLLGKDATTRGIRKALAELRLITKDATVFIFFSGHGAKESGDAFWVTHDSELGGLGFSAIPDREVRALTDRIPSNRLIMLLDCCYAAATVKENKSVVDIAEALKSFVGKGRVTITASGKGDEAIEAEDLEHGVFAHFLLAALRGAADGDGGPADGVVTVPELTAYIDRHVADEARMRKGYQKPNIFMEEVQDPGKFLVTIDARRIAELAAAALRETALVKSRIESLKKLLVDDAINAEQFQLGKRLLGEDPSRLDARDRERLDYFLELVTGKIPANRLQKLLDSVETPEQRAARLERERIAALVTSTLGRLEAACKKKNGDEAYRLFAELTNLSPSHPSLDEWLKRVEELGPAKELTLDLGGGVKLELVLIPAGDFLMGSPDSEDSHQDDESPVHRVKFDQPFYMGKYEVTVGQFAAFVDATGYRTEAEKGGQSFEEGKKGGYSIDDGGNWTWREDVTWRSPGFSQGEDHPVVLVSWNDARSFCAWLSEKTGRRVSLPSEAQWEYACRSGDGREFPWGGRWPPSGSAGNYADETAKKKYSGWTIIDGYRDGHVTTAAVGSFTANAFGLHDMGGNAWEWCEDWYHENYDGAPSDERAWTSGGKQESRVLRGGSWVNGLRWFLRSASRYRYWPVNRYSFIGLRVGASLGT